MSVPIGTIIAVGFDAGAVSEPGFLPCHGGEVSRTVYPDLFGIIGTSWGAGDGATTFNLPDFRGLFIRGVDDGANADLDVSSRQAIAPGGAQGNNAGSIQYYGTALPASGTLTTSFAGDHQHEVPHLPNVRSKYIITDHQYAQWNDGGARTSIDGNHFHTVSAGGDAESRPVNVYVDYMVYAGE
jgi:phage-related tail fiber protein